MATNELEQLSTLHLLHRLWTKAVDAPAYNKAEWSELETRITRLLPILDASRCRVCGDPVLDGLTVCYDHAKAGPNGEPADPPAAVCLPATDDLPAWPPTGAEYRAVYRRAMAAGVSQPWDRLTAFTASRQQARQIAAQALAETLRRRGP